MLRAKHYAEEWNHYHYFLKALKALGFTRGERRPLGAAADDAGAVELHAPGGPRGHPRLLDLLGGARGDDHRSRDLQPVLRASARSSTASRKEAIAPIYAHLDLDVQYQHSDLFLDICRRSTRMTAERARPRPGVRPPARRAHLAVDREHREVLRATRASRCRGRAVRPASRLTSVEDTPMRRPDGIPRAQAHARRSSAHATGTVVIEYLASEVTLDGDGRRPVRQDAAAPRRQHAARAASPSGSTSRRSASRSLARAERTGVLALVDAPSDGPQAMRASSSTSCHRKYCAHWLRAGLRPPLVGAHRRRARPPAPR